MEPKNPNTNSPFNTPSFQGSSHNNFSFGQTENSQTSFNPSMLTEQKGKQPNEFKTEKAGVKERKSVCASDPFATAMNPQHPTNIFSNGLFGTNKFSIQTNSPAQNNIFGNVNGYGYGNVNGNVNGNMNGNVNGNVNGNGYGNVDSPFSPKCHVCRKNKPDLLEHMKDKHQEEFQYNNLIKEEKKRVQQIKNNAQYLQSIHYEMRHHDNFDKDGYQEMKNNLKKLVRRIDQIK